LFWLHLIYLRSAQQNKIKEVRKSSVKELKNSNLPDEIRIGAILRGKNVIIPRSNFVFKKEDIVVFLAKKNFLQVVENMFRISSI
jgi:trk system potassium uptake protein TrkA